MIKQRFEKWKHFTEQQLLKHGLSGYEVRMNRRKTAMGLHRIERNYLGQITKKVISISYYAVKFDDDAMIKDTCLHEVAHALDYARRGMTDHGKEWKKCAREVGAKPERCGHSKIGERIRSKYTLTCPKCRRKSARHRKPKRRVSCGPCGNGKFNPALVMEVTQNY